MKYLRFTILFGLYVQSAMAATVYEGLDSQSKPVVTVDLRDKEAVDMVNLSGFGYKRLRAEINCYKNNMPPFEPVCYINLQKKH